MERRVIESLPPVRFGWGDLVRLLVLIGLATALLPGGFGRVPAALAQDRSADYSNFDVFIDLEDDASLLVTERQEIRFTGGPFQNGFREIPVERSDGITDIVVSQVTGSGEQPLTYVAPGNFAKQPGTYTAQRQGEFVRIDWSFPRVTDQTLTFDVDYRILGALQVFPDNDPPMQEISWMVVGPALSESVPVRAASVTINLPNPVTEAQVNWQPADRAPTVSNDGRSWTWTSGSLSGGDFFEQSFAFPNQVEATAPSWQQDFIRERAAAQASEQQNAFYSLIAIAVAALAAIGGGLGIFGLWYTRGRDPHVGLVADFIPQPPDTMAPGLAGTLLDEVAGEPEFVATMIDLAQRGVMKITETSSGGIMGIGASRDYDVTMLQPDATLAPYETALVNAIFSSKWERNEVVQLSQVKDRMNTARPVIQQEIYDQLVDRKYFPSSPETTRQHYRSLGLGVTVVAILLGVLLTGFLNLPAAPVWIVCAIIAGLGIVLTMVSGRMPKRTAAGAEAAAKWEAFKRYLNSIERYENLNEAQGIFEKYLPYAIAFGIDHSWVQKFAAVQAPAPDWFDTSGGGMVLGPDVYGPSGRRMRGARGGNVVIFPGGGWGAPGGNREGNAGGGDSGGWGFPDLQGGSDSAGRSLESASGGLFDLFNSAGSFFGSSGSGSSGGSRSSWGGGGGFSGGGGGGGGSSSGGGGGGFS